MSHFFPRVQPLNEKRLDMSLHESMNHNKHKVHRASELPVNSAEQTS